MTTNDKNLEMVREFQSTYDCKVNLEPNISDKALSDMRVNLLQEELDELKEALDNNDIVEVLDALTDLQYILDGTYLSFGLQNIKQVAFDEVHRSNMSKLGDEGEVIRREDGKILKGPNYFKPDLKQFL